MTGTQYVSISRRALDLEDYIDIARRHIGWIVGPAFAGLVVSVVVANFLPNTYISRAVMQITPATISENLVQSVSTTQLNERVQQMQNEILSRQSLSAMITDPKLQLYASDLKHKPLEDVIDQMRQDVKIDLAIVPGAQGKRASAFTIQFSYADRYKARDTVQGFVSKFNAANLNAQRTQSVVANQFVGSELKQAKANLDELDTQLTNFKIHNTGKLPEEAQYNMSSLQALNNQAVSMGDSLNRLEQARLQIEAAASTAKQQLITMEALSQDNAADASSPVAQKNEELAQLTRQLKDMDTRIDVLRQSFRDNYPDLRDLIKTREVLGKKQAALKAEQDAEDSKPKSAKATARRGNPQMVTAMAEIRGRLEQYNAQLEGIKRQKSRDQENLDKINAEITKYQRLLAATPGIDLNYKSLERQEKNAQEKYQELLKKQQLAQTSDDLISAEAAEKLEVLDPPSLPEQPSEPKRPRIIGAGFAMSIILGFAMAAGREAKDASLKNLKDVRAYTNMPVLSSIPLLENALMVRRKRRITYLAWSAAIIVGAVMVTVSLYYRYSMAA